MGDVKDILGVSRSHQPKADVKKEKEKAQRPAGMSREAFALFDGSHPIVPSLADDLHKKSMQGLKEKRKDHKVTWQWQTFTNESRQDGLKLSHWIKSLVDATGKARAVNQGSYQFAKYNRKVLVHRYSDEEWDNVIAKDPAWSKDETDYLLDLCQLFQLRFLVIADRYQFAKGPDNRMDRSMEDLKARYYSIARQLMISREGNQEDLENRTLIKSPFDPNHERQRKQAALMMMNRSPQEEAEENAILEAAKAIESARRAEELTQRANAPAGANSPTAAAAAAEAIVMDFAQPVPSGRPSLLSPTLQPTKPAAPGVYCRRAHTREQAQAQLSSLPGGARMAKTAEAMYTDLHVADPPKIGTRAVCATWLALRGEIIQVLELRNKLNTVQRASGPGYLSDIRKKPPKGKSARNDDFSDMPSSKRPRTAKKYSDE